MRPRLFTVSKELQHWATHDPDMPAFIFYDVTWRRRVISRADLYRLAARYASILRRKGVKRGDIVCNTLPNSPERLISDLGIVLAGATAMNGQIMLADGKDFIGSLKAAGCCAIVLDPQQPKGAAAVLEARVHTEDGRHVQYPDLPDLKQLLPVYWSTDGQQQGFTDMLEEEQETFVSDVTPDDVADVWTTSGSTGFSKLVPRTHRVVLSFGHAFYTFMGLKPGDVYYNDRALGWAGGFPGSFLTHGTTRVALDLSQGVPEDPTAFTWDVLTKERVSVAYLVPTQLLHLINHVEELRQKEKNQWKLRVIGTGSQPIRKKHMDAIGKISERVDIGYGSTEAGVISGKVVKSQESYEDCNNGHPVEGAEIKIVDDDMKDVPNNVMGEIVVRGDQVFTHYIKNEEATKKAFTPDGWHRTGDVGYLNDKGEVFTICRKAYSIMRGPYLVYPGWLEDRISRCPGVEDVLVVPVPDPVLYQELCACIILQPGASLSADQVREFCSQLFLTEEKSEMTAVPRYYLFFQHFPTTNTGKTCRRSTAAMARQKLGLDSELPLSK